MNFYKEEKFNCKRLELFLFVFSLDQFKILDELIRLYQRRSEEIELNWF